MTKAQISPLRQRLLDSQNKGRKFKSVDLEGITVVVKSPSVGQAAVFQKLLKNDADQSVVVAQMLIALCVDPDTNQAIFTPEDEETLRDLPASAPLVSTVVAAITEMSEAAQSIDSKSAKKR